MEYVIAIIGPRGSGKSLYLAYIGCVLLENNVRVLSGMPIKATIPDSKRVLEAETVDVVKFMITNKKVRDYALLADEYQFIAAARRAMSNKNLFVNQYSTQLRKDGCTLAFTVQSFMWIDPYSRFQVDIMAECQDAYFTDYGRDNKLGRGELIFVTLRDVSGVITGHPAEFTPGGFPMAQPFATLSIEGKPIWQTYDSYRKIGVDEVFKKYEIDTKTFEVSLDNPADAMDKMPDISKSFQLQHKPGDWDLPE